MKNNISNYSRRRFISSCSACAACLAFSPSLLARTPGTAPETKTRIKVVYSLHSAVQSQPDWPNTGFDFRPVMESINRALASRFRDVEFMPVMAAGKEDALKIVAEDKTGQIGGYIVYQMNCWNQVVQTLSETGKPVLYADFQFGGSGGFLVYTASFLRAGKGNIGFVASSRPEDMLKSVECMLGTIKNNTADKYAALAAEVRKNLTPKQRNYTTGTNQIAFKQTGECIKELNNSKIIAVNDQKSAIAPPILGIPVEYIPFAELNSAWESASRDEAKAQAEKWQKNASRVIDVPFDTLVNSAAMYLGMKSVIKTHGAGAITVNCLGGFYGGHIHAYPCLGFHELCNEGLVGGCECDVRSTATMLAFNKLSGGRPGFISDPVIDTGKLRIIYAHCVASNKVFGPEGKSNPFDIMTHSEDRKGASVRSILPVDLLTTTLEANNERKEILMHQAVALDNDPDDRACRTKLSAEPLGDIEKLFTMWDKWGWHRVTFYGDFRDPVHSFADAIGWKVVEEA